MATTILYADESSGRAQSLNSGATASGVSTTEVYYALGRITATNHREGFLAWDVSSIPGGDTIVAATVSLVIDTDLTTYDPVWEIRAYDWGATLDTDDWRTGAQLTALTLLATLDSATSGGTGLRDLASTAALTTSTAGWASGWVRAVLASDTVRTGEPTHSANEYIVVRFPPSTGTANDPRLTITHEPPADPIDIDISATLPLMTCSATIASSADIEVAATLPLMTCAAIITSPGASVAGPATLVATATRVEVTASATRTTLTITPA